MQIKAIQKTTLIDYPGHIASTIFVGGCNFRCDYCYNKDLVLRPAQLKTIPTDEVLAFLASRAKLLEGVVITGGEPTIQPGLAEFITAIRDLGLLVKLDTNGYKPEIVDNLLHKNLINCLAMDIKGPLERYAEITGISLDTNTIERSIKLIKESGIPYEFRTTVWHGGFTEKDFLQMFKMIAGAERYYIQNMYPAFTLQPTKTYAPMQHQEIAAILEVGKTYIKEIDLRGEWH